jgi:hypothetical protein
MCSRKEKNPASGDALMIAAGRHRDDGAMEWRGSILGGEGDGMINLSASRAGPRTHVCAPAR